MYGILYCSDLKPERPIVSLSNLIVLKAQAGQKNEPPTNNNKCKGCSPIHPQFDRLLASCVVDRRPRPYVRVSNTLGIM
jgi:hypothetical protein